MFKVIYFMIFWNGDNPVNEGFSLFFKKNVNWAHFQVVGKWTFSKQWLIREERN